MHVFTFEIGPNLQAAVISYKLHSEQDQGPKACQYKWRFEFLSASASQTCLCLLRYSAEE